MSIKVPISKLKEYWKVRLSKMFWEFNFEFKVHPKLTKNNISYTRSDLQYWSYLIDDLKSHNIKNFPDPTFTDKNENRDELGSLLIMRKICIRDLIYKGIGANLYISKMMNCPDDQFEKTYELIRTLDVDESKIREYFNDMINKELDNYDLQL